MAVPAQVRRYADGRVGVPILPGGSGSGGDCARLGRRQVEHHAHQAGGIGRLAVEPERLCQLLHRQVAFQNVAVDALDLAPLGPAHQPPHQVAAQPHAVDVMADQDRELGVAAVVVDHDPGDRAHQRLARRQGFGRDQGEFPARIGPGQAVGLRLAYGAMDLTVGLVAILLAGFCLVTIFFFHNDFADPLQGTLALKNLAIMGGLLMTFAYGQVRGTFDYMRERRKALGGYIPQRRRKATQALTAPKLVPEMLRIDAS